MPSRRILNEQGLLQTTTAAQQTALTVPFPPDSSAGFALEVLATSDGIDVGFWRLEAAARRVASGNVAFVGGAATSQVVRKTAGASAWDIAFSGSGGSAQVLVTGGPVPVEWIARLIGTMSLPLDNPPQDPPPEARAAGSLSAVTGGAED